MTQIPRDGFQNNDTRGLTAAEPREAQVEAPGAAGLGEKELFLPGCRDAGARIRIRLLSDSRFKVLHRIYQRKDALVERLS